MKSIAAKFLLPVVVLAVALLALDLYQEYSTRQEDMTKLVDRQATMALTFDLAIRSYVAEEIRPAMEQRVAPGEFFPETMSTSFVARSIFEKVRQDFPDYTIKFSSDDPRNPDNQAGPDELRMIQYFNDHPETKKWSGEIDLGGRPHVAHFNARRMKESCLHCHGNPEDAPASLIERYGVTAGFHRPVGEVIALDTVAIPLDKPRAAFLASMRDEAVFLVTGLGMLVVLIALTFRFVVARRLAALRTHFERIASQPDAAALRPAEVSGNDEVSALARSFNTMVERVRDAHASLEQRVADQTAHLRDNEERLQTILDTIQAGVIVIDEQSHTIVDANPAALAMIGASREEVVGRVCQKYICPAEVGCCPITDLGQKVDNSEGVLVKADGQTIPVLNTVTPVMLNGRRHLLDSFVDISELKQAEKALAKSEQKFMDIFYNSADATLLIDDETFVDCNERTVEMLRASNKEEVLSTHPSELSPETQPDGRSSFEKANEMIATAFERGSNRFEWDHRRLDCEVFPVEVTLMPISLFGKQMLYCMWKDITERRRIEKIARESEERVELALNGADLGLWDWNVQTGDVVFNKRWAKMLGYSLDEIEPHLRSWKKLVHPDDMPGVQEALNAHFDGATRSYEAQMRMRAKSGEWKWILDRGKVIARDEDGKPRRACGTHLDITERKQAEEELRENNAMMVDALQSEKRAAMELEAAMEQLEAAKRDAEAATRSKSEFLANMSHEIRTPMTAILGFTETMLDADISDSDRLNVVHTVRRNGEHLLQIINDILDISKIEAGKLEVERIRCSPVQLVAEVRALMQVRADAKSLPFNIEYLGAVPETIESDPTRLKQILVNLIGNAIKFTETGGVRLVTRFVDTDPISETRPAEPMMQLDIVDTGIGMTEEQVGRLFQAFNQADTSTTRKFGGTGLGLNISKRLAELLGGGITVESKAGEGSLFRVTVATGPLEGVKMIEDPLSATVLDTEGTAGLSPRGVAQTSSYGSSKLDCRILLAEDGPDNQRLISFVLQKAGAEITVAENGKLAASAALAARDEGNPFDVILMDMQMPVMDGYEATGLLRQKGYTRPIIALTAHAMASDRQKCLDAGCDDYASKPVNRKKLIETIRQHLGTTVAVGTSA